MVMKRALSSLLVFTFIMPATLASHAFAQGVPATSSTASILAFSDDPIQLILAAMKTTSADEARALLLRAKQKIAEERLPQDSQRTIGLLLARAESKLPATSNLALANVPQTFTIAETNSAAGASVANSIDDFESVEAMMEQNPDLRDSMREISRGRLMRDAKDLPQIILDQTDQSIEAHDQADAANQKALTDIGGFVVALRAMGAIGDYAAINKALREKYDTVPISTLANQIISDQTRWSMGAGALKQILMNNGYSSTREFAGVSVEAAMTFTINVNLIMQLSDLYNIKMTSNQQEVVILFALMMGKVALHYSNKPVLVQRTAEKMGELIVTAAHAKTPGALGRLVTHVLGLPLFKSIVKTLPVTGSASAAGAAVASGAAATGVVQGVNWKVRMAQIIKGAIFSGAETYTIGRIAKYMMTRAADQERQLANESFRNYLMSSKGEGFIKLLILAMNTGLKVPNVIRIKNTREPKANFILNLARSTRVCSPQDNVRFLELKKLAAKSSSFSSTLVDRDYKILRFACDSNLSSGRYERMAREFATFDEIPEELVATLRVASYENRLRMGEVLLQLQFLDGDQDPKELRFFESTIGKILGFERLDDSKYFDRMHAFIREQGGMTPQPSSPTGYSIGDKKVASPYDLAIGYTAAGGPDSPRTTVIPTTTTTTTTTSPAPTPAPGLAGLATIKTN